MKQILQAATLSAALFAAGPALACRNEPRTEYEEREFRSRYNKKKSASTRVMKALPDTTSLLGGLAMGGLGLALAIGGYRRAKKKDLAS